MAVLYISEYANLQFEGSSGRGLAMGSEPSNTEQTVAISGSSTQSSAFQNNTRFVRLHTDAICSVMFGSNPTSTTSKKRLAANQTEYFAVQPGQNVAVITNT